MTKMKELQQLTMWLAKISYLTLGKGVKTLTDMVYKLNTIYLEKVRAIQESLSVVCWAR